jgi:flagellar hook-associated protein 1 FlgK
MQTLLPRQQGGSNNYTFAFSNDTSNTLAALGINTFFSGATAGGMGVNSQIGTNKDYIAAAQVDNNPTSSSYRYFATGDNTNALAITDLQYTSQTISQWTVDRVNASISRTNDFNQIMTTKLEAVRDSISAVNLDEEMTNMIKFQHAYTAASKLISVADELLTTLLATK